MYYCWYTFQDYLREDFKEMGINYHSFDLLAFIHIYFCNKTPSSPARTANFLLYILAHGCISALFFNK
jgi:hypothetical protein